MERKRLYICSNFHLSAEQANSFTLNLHKMDKTFLAVVVVN